MKFDEIQELIKLIDNSELSEFKLKDGEFELSIRTKHYVKAKQGGAANGAQQPVVAMPPIPPTYTSSNPSPAEAAPAKATSKSDKNQESPAEAAEESEENYVPIKSPIVGTFYRSPSPEKEAYVKVGDVIEAGSVVCIVEAMKLFNEIESDVSGKIVKVMVEDAQPVEYDQALFLVDPAG